MAELLAATPCLGECFRPARRNSDGFLQAALRGGKVVAQSVSPAQIVKHTGVGGVEPTGPFEEINRLLIFKPPPRVGGLLKEAREGAFRNGTRSLHRGICSERRTPASIPEADGLGQRPAHGG
jgi:hypothetical protein